MGRGLGQTQIMLLHAIGRLDQEDPEAWWCVYAALNDVWKTHLKVQHDAAVEHDRQQVARDKVEWQERAAAGDGSAKAALDRAFMLSQLAAMIRRRRRWGPRHDKGVMERALNPSRALKALARRGLIERHAQTGQGAAFRLTDAGRAHLAQLNPTDRMAQ